MPQSTLVCRAMRQKKQRKKKKQPQKLAVWRFLQLERLAFSRAGEKSLQTP